MKVNVLLSTYNGEKYLKEQIDSLFAQSVDGLFLTMRDDGSIDGTIDIINEYENIQNFKCYKGKNLGCAKSFWHLIQHSEDAEYYAFCDQDDVWDSDKLLVAITTLEKEDNNVPLLYFSDVRVVDSNLNIISNGMVEAMPIDYAHSLIKNIAPGCTYVFNKKAKELLLKYDPEVYGIDIHDWTVYKIVACFGKVVFDKDAHMSYRQHENNVIGANKHGFKYLINKTKMFFCGKNKHLRRDNALRLEKCYGEMMTTDNLELTRLFSHYDSDKKIKKAFIKDKRFYFRGIKYRYFKMLIRLNKI